MTTTGGTVRLHRVLRAPPERVYKAFVDAGALQRWLPPFGFTGRIHEIDVRVGGGYKMSFTNFGTGFTHSFTVTFTELTPPTRIRHSDRFDDPNLPGEMQVTVDLRAVSCGTELAIVQAGIPAVIPEEACYLGWQESLQMLARVVEPEIPDGT
ncbi:MAG: SRPBCC family protein [Burkholderiaceae bacterium]